MLSLLLLASQTITLQFAPPPASNAACPCAKDWEAKIYVPKFDPALGTLTGVRFEVPVVTGGLAGGAILFENTSAAPVFGAHGYAGIVFLYSFASDRQWIYGGAEQISWGQPLGMFPSGVADTFYRGATIPPFDGHLDFLGPSSTGFCMPQCGTFSPGATVWPWQQSRFIGTGTVEILYQPRMNWWLSREASRLAFARNLPILPQEGRVIYTYEAP